MSKIQRTADNMNGITPERASPGAPETATEEVNRRDAALPHDGLSPEYDEEEADPFHEEDVGEGAKRTD